MVLSRTEDLSLASGRQLAKLASEVVRGPLCLIGRLLFKLFLSSIGTRPAACAERTLLLLVPRSLMFAKQRGVQQNTGPDGSVPVPTLCLK